MKITITINIDNAAFEYDKLAEVKRLLTGLATSIAHGVTEGKLLDYNGNTVGKFVVDEEEKGE